MLPDISPIVYQEVSRVKQKVIEMFISVGIVLACLVLASNVELKGVIQYIYYILLFLGAANIVFASLKVMKGLRNIESKNLT